MSGLTYRELLHRWWRRFLARQRLSGRAICEESKGGRDYHDWGDRDSMTPWHFVEHECERCGKKFTI